MNKRRAKTVASGVALALGVSLLTATPAFAINRTNCNGKNDVFLISDKSTCWANRGDIFVNLYNVTMISTPAYEVELRFSNGRQETYHPNGALQRTAGEHVTWINIK